MATLSFAGVASAAPAGGGVQAATTQPDVASAAITDQPAITTPGGTPRVKVCFDSQIANPVAANFAVSGTDVTGTGNPLVPASAASIPAELSCTSLSFPAGTNLAAFSTVEVQAGAVSPPGGGAGTNPQGAVALTGGDVSPGPGKTSGPNLTGASVAGVSGGTDVTFTFDKLITQAGAGAPVAGRFGYYNAGVATAAASLTGVGDRSVTVRFATAVTAGSRVFAGYNAVTVAGQIDEGNAATATSGAGGAPPATSAPDLVSVARVPSLQATFDLTYDENVTSTNVTAPLCVADTPTGRFNGTAVTLVNATTIRVTFGTLAANAGADAEVVRVTDAGACAVNIALTTSSSVGTAPIQNKDHTPGFTSGPELTGCSAPAGTDVTYTFDELLTTGAVPPNGLSLIDTNGAKVAGTVLQVANNTATVRYASAGVLAAAAACSADRNAVTDRQPGGAEPSSLNTVKVNSVGTPENAGPPPPPAPVPGPTPGPPKAFPKQAARSLGISTSCHRTTRGRVTCTTKGTLKLATSLAPLGKKLICTGKIRVRYTAGSKTLSSKTTKLRNTCTYKAKRTFKASARQRARLRVQAKYLGSPVSLTKNSKKIKARVRRR
jgi:hypothetical protein